MHPRHEDAIGRSKQAVGYVFLQRAVVARGATQARAAQKDALNHVRMCAEGSDLQRTLESITPLALDEVGGRARHMQNRCAWRKQFVGDIRTSKAEIPAGRRLLSEADARGLAGEVSSERWTSLSAWKSREEFSPRMCKFPKAPALASLPLSSFSISEVIAREMSHLSPTSLSGLSKSSFM